MTFVRYGTPEKMTVVNFKQCKYCRKLIEKENDLCEGCKVKNTRLKEK